MQLYGIELTSRLLLGSARYPSPAMLADEISTNPRLARNSACIASLRSSSMAISRNAAVQPRMQPRGRH